MINLEDLDDFLQKNQDNIDPIQIEGFQNVLTGLDEFFEEESTMSVYDDSRIEVFSSAALESTDIIRASPSFHGKPIFSNVIVSAERDMNWYSLVRIYYNFI